MDNRKTSVFQDFAPYAFLAFTDNDSEYSLFVYSEFPVGFEVVNTKVKYNKKKTVVTLYVSSKATNPGDPRGNWAGKFDLKPKNANADFIPEKTDVEIIVSIRGNAVRKSKYNNVLSYSDCSSDALPKQDFDDKKAYNCPYIYLSVPDENPNKKHPDNFAYEPNLILFLKGYELAKANEINTLSSPRNGVFETLIILKKRPGNELTLKGDKLKTNKFAYYNSPGTGGNFTVIIDFVSDSDEAKRIRKQTTVERHLEDAKAEFPELNGQAAAAMPLGPKPKKRKSRIRNMSSRKT